MGQLEGRVTVGVFVVAEEGKYIYFYQSAAKLLIIRLQIHSLWTNCKLDFREP